MAVPTGLEPAIFCVTGRHVNHYTMEPLKTFAFNWPFKYTKTEHNCQYFKRSLVLFDVVREIKYDTIIPKANNIILIIP